jgi:hypothetical protein
MLLKLTVVVWVELASGRIRWQACGSCPARRSSSSEEWRRRPTDRPTDCSLAPGAVLTSIRVSVLPTHSCSVALGSAVWRHSALWCSAAGAAPPSCVIYCCSLLFFILGFYSPRHIGQPINTIHCLQDSRGKCHLKTKAKVMLKCYQAWRCGLNCSRSSHKLPAASLVRRQVPYRSDWRRSGLHVTS